MNKYYVFLPRSQRVTIQADTVAIVKGFKDYPASDGYPTIQLTKDGKIVAEFDEYNGWALADQVTADSAEESK